MGDDFKFTPGTIPPADPGWKNIDPPSMVKDPVSTEPSIDQRYHNTIQYEPPAHNNTQRAIFLGPLLPKDFRAHREGSGVRLSAVDRDPIESRNGAVRYVFSWAAGVDGSTQEGLEAGFARAEIVGDGPVPKKEDQVVSTFLADPRYQVSGYFFCHSVDALGKRSDDTLASSLSSNDFVDSRVPGDVTRFQASESGEVANGTVFSAISYYAIAPFDDSFAGLQLFFKDYPSIDQTQEAYFHHFAGQSGGVISGKQLYPPCRRKGTGTISVTNGSTSASLSFGAGDPGAFAVAKAGDQLEILGVRVNITAVPFDDELTIDAWPGETLVIDDWTIIGLVTVYGVAVSKGGTHRADIENSPSVAMLFDGELSAPVSPSVLATALGNSIRIDLTPSPSTEIAKYILYRGIGTGAPYNMSDPVHVWTADSSNFTPFQPFIDNDFSIYDREHGQIFAYRATAVNVRGEESAPSLASEAACRLDSPSDNAPTLPRTALNQIWNGHINGTNAGSVSAADAVQDTNMGGAAPAGRARWTGLTSGSGSVPGHVNTNEVVFGMVGLGTAGLSILQQDIGAWDNATAAKRRMPANRLLVFQCKVRTSGGTPSGILYIDVMQYDSATLTLTPCSVRTRLSTDVIDTSGISVGINGSDIGVDPSVVWGVFVPDVALTTTEFRARIYYSVSSYNGVNVWVSEAMLSITDDLPAYTPQMADPAITYSRTSGGAPIPGAGFDPDKGTRDGKIGLITP